MRFEIKQVLNFLENYENIERVLERSYRKIEYPFTRPGVRARYQSLFSKELYELIVKLGRLPKVTEYEEHFIKNNLSRSINRIALEYHANVAYKALVLDLHFYFMLKNSKLFDDVQIKYEHDIAAKTDILLRKGDKELGVQVFSGDENYRLSKQKSIDNIQGRLGYELILYNLRDHLELKKKIYGADNSEILLFSKRDVQNIASYISGAKPHIVSEDKQGDIFEILPLEMPAVKVSQNDDVQYSYIFIGPLNKDTKRYLKELHRKGIKLFWCNLKEGNKTFTAIDGQMFMLDGEQLSISAGMKYISRFKKYLKNFNLQQYMVEHAPENFNLAVNAGAGSGKTTTLVSRILYLLFTNKIESLQELAMITFTNEAAINMKEALEERLEELYRRTGNPKHYQYLQEINAMQIVTIPTFAKEVLKRFSHYLGLSANIKVSEMTMSFRMILEKALDEEIAHHKENPFEKLAYYKITNFLESVWDKLNQKGIVEEELKKYLRKNQNDDVLKTVIIRILRNVEKDFTELKFDQDFLTVSDLTRFLKILISHEVPLSELRESYKYLLVDEFQDTDIAQIQFIATVAAQTGLHLTVVGDTKQSVYRFRGADSTAFTVLDEYLISNKAPSLNNYNLIENFRSSKELIEKMEEIFGKWRVREFLPSHEKSMKSNRQNNMNPDDIFALYEDKFSMENMLIDFELMPTDGKKPTVLAILVRNNHEAIQIGEMLKQLENGPEYEVRTEGTLYTSRAARDLGVLLNSWLQANSDNVASNQAIFSLSESAFCYNDDSFTFTYVDKIVSGKDFQLNIPKAWYDALILMKDKPVLSVIENFLSKSDYVVNLDKQKVDEKDILKYELNLEKIMLEIYTKFDFNATLVQIYAWLKLQIATNRESDEAELEDTEFKKNFIRVMTVHKSKGLQFHTVIIPYPDNQFIKSMESIKEDIIVQIDKNDNLKFGWKYEDEQNQFTNITTNYKDLRKEEEEEQRREEARILYVAMTRAEQSLKVYGLENAEENSSNPNTWGDLLLI